MFIKTSGIKKKVPEICKKQQQRSLRFGTLIFNVAVVLTVLDVLVCLCRFPSEYLGLLYGVMLVTCGAVAPFQYALYAWVEVSGHTMVNRPTFLHRHL